MPIDIRPISLDDVRVLCEHFHGYGSAGNAAAYAFGVFENGLVIAAYAWQPPPPGAARAVCPEAPQGVLALSRMVAVKKEHRELKHVSKPLRVQMKKLIDRTRWPVLVTYSDEGQGHTGYVYQCSGWEKTTRSKRPFFVDAQGKRASSYSNGKHGARDLERGGLLWCSDGSTGSAREEWRQSGWINTGGVVCRLRVGSGDRATRPTPTCVPHE